MSADNLPIVCYFDVDVPNILPFQLYIISELEYINQETIATFDFSSDTIESMEKAGYIEYLDKSGEWKVIKENNPFIQELDSKC